MINTYVRCRDWSWEDKLLYIKACIGEDMPHDAFCGSGRFTKKELLDMYRNTAGFIYCRDGMLSYDTPRANPFTGALKEIDISTLRAAALEEKPKRVKVSYEKVEESIFDLRKDFEAGCLFGDSSGLIKVDCLAYLGASCETGNIYRRVETEISERDEFIEFIKTKFNNDKRFIDKSIAEALFDAGCRFKLVEGE